MAFKVLIPHGCMARAPMTNYKLGPTLVAHPPCHEARSLLLQGWVGGWEKTQLFSSANASGVWVLSRNKKNPDSYE